MNGFFADRTVNASLFQNQCNKIINENKKMGNGQTDYQLVLLVKRILILHEQGNYTNSTKSTFPHLNLSKCSIAIDAHWRS